MPSGAYVSPYWVLLRRGCPWLFTNARPSTPVSWFISCPTHFGGSLAEWETQSLYPGRPRGGLTIVPSRHPLGADLSPMGEDFVAQFLLHLNLCVPHARSIGRTLLLHTAHTRHAQPPHSGLTWHARHRCAPPRASPSCATEPGPYFRMNRVFIARIFRTSVGSSLSAPPLVHLFRSF
jgi:hypothetical protein